MEILQPLITAPLNKAMACCVSEFDEAVAAGFAVLYERMFWLHYAITRCIAAEKFGHLHFLFSRHFAVLF